MKNDNSEARPSADTGRPESSEQELGALVRELASSWTMPPRRIGQSTWRDRVDARRRPNAANGLWRRLVGAAAAAITATVALALVAVWLSTPRAPLGSGSPVAGPGSSASPAPATATPGAPSAAASSAPSLGTSVAPSVATPGATSGPTSIVPSPLPSATFMAPIADRSVLVRGPVGYALLDTHTGAFGPTLFTPSPGSAVFRQSDGSYLCACFEESGATRGGMSTSRALTLRTVGLDGTTTRQPVNGANYAGAPLRSTNPDMWVVTASATFDAAGARAYVGFAVLDGDTWRRGIDVVDVAAGRIIDSIPVASVPDSDHDVPVWAWEPLVRIAPDGGHVMVLLTRVVGNSGIARVDRQAYTLKSAGAIGLSEGPPNAITTACEAPIEGWAGPDRYYLLCPGGNGTIATYDLAGRMVGTVAVAAGSGPELGVSAVVDAAGRVFVWNPYGRSITVVDSQSGRLLFSGAAPAIARVDAGDPVGDLLHRIGAWLAPSAAAKVYLSPALLASPDGKRLYALGITQQNINGSGSTGVDMFDTQSLSFVGHVAPNADWYSMALSADGRQLYVAGLPGVDATGGTHADQPPSMTILDAMSGQVDGILGHVQFIADLGVTSSP